jgi:tetratricopeptide (TPR) repeat protein
MTNLALVLMEQGRLDEAETVLRDAIAQWPESGFRPEAVHQLSKLLQQRGRYAEADSMLTWMIERSASCGNRDPRTRWWSPVIDLAYGKLYQGALTEAESLFVETLTIIDRLPEPDRDQQILVLNGLGCTLTAWGRLAEADSTVAQSLELAAGGDWRRALALRGLGDLRRAQGRYAEAESALREALAVYEGVSVPDQRSTGMTALEIGMLLGEQGCHDEAEAALRRSLVTLECCGWHRDWCGALVENQLAACLSARGELELATDHWTASRPTLLATTAVPFQLRRRALQSTIRAMEACGGCGEAEPYHAALTAMRR